MADRAKRLARELGLTAAPPPFEVDSKNICRRVEAILSAEERERNCYMKHKIRMAAVLVAAAVALTGTALAAGPSIGEMLQAALGAFAPYAQRVDGITAVDQGLEVRIVSALSDGNIIRVYFEVRDLDADRLDDATTTNFFLDPPSVDETGWTTCLEHPAECIHYDPKNKTALFVSTLIGDGHPASGLTLTAHAQCFTPGSGKKIKGDWILFKIPLVNAPVRKIDMSGSGNVICGVEVKSLTMTSLGVTIEGDPHSSHQILNYPLTFYLSDGSLCRIDGADSGSYNARHCTNHWSFSQPVDINEISGVSIGMWYISLEGGTAHPGYWLSELPK